MAALAANALVTYEEYCEFLGKATTDNNLPEDRFNLFCNGASNRIEKHCRRKFVAASVSEVHSGDGQADLYVKNVPITATPTVKYWDGLQWTETTGTFTYDGDSGRIRFTDGGVFWRGKDNWQITYAYGYAVASVPFDLKMACSILIQRAMKKADGKEGVSSETFADQTTGFSLSKMPEDVVEMLQMYVRPAIG